MLLALRPRPRGHLKSEAADLVFKQNYSVIEASRSLGVGGRHYAAGSTRFSTSAKALPHRAKR
jgi:hypothetical protein